MVARAPLIPGVNDDPDTIRAIGRALIARAVRRATLLPFNPATGGKYSWLGRQTPFHHAKRQGAERVAELEGVLAELGIELVPA